MPKLNMTCKKGRPRGRRRRSPDGEPPSGLKMTCDCEPVGARMGIGGCEYPPRTRRKQSMIHGTAASEHVEQDTDAC